MTMAAEIKNRWVSQIHLQKFRCCFRQCLQRCCAYFACKSAHGEALGQQDTDACCALL